MAEIEVNNVRRQKELEKMINGKQIEFLHTQDASSKKLIKFLYQRSLQGVLELHPARQVSPLQRVGSRDQEGRLLKNLHS
jgi:hypothetical protein